MSGTESNHHGQGDGAILDVPTSNHEQSIISNQPKC